MSQVENFYCGVCGMDSDVAVPSYSKVPGLRAFEAQEALSAKGWNLVAPDGRVAVYSGRCPDCWRSWVMYLNAAGA